MFQNIFVCTCYNYVFAFIFCFIYIYLYILSLNEVNKTANMNLNLLTRHYKLKLMNDFMYIKYQNPKMKQSEITKELNLSSSTVQRYRNDINMFSP